MNRKAMAKVLRVMARAMKSSSSAVGGILYALAGSVEMGIDDQMYDALYPWIRAQRDALRNDMLKAN